MNKVALQCAMNAEETGACTGAIACCEGMTALEVCGPSEHLLGP